MANDTAPAFRWTAQEKDLLRQALRVRVLEEGRLEVELTVNTLLDYLVGVLAWIGFPAAVAATASVATTDVVAGHLQVTPLVFIALPLITLPMMSYILGVGAERPPPLSLFPGTSWIVSHRLSQNAIGRLDPTECPPPTFGSTVYLATTIDYYRLRTRISASRSQRRRVQELILTRCKSKMPEDDVPKIVADLVGSDVASVPTAFYNPLYRYTRLVSVTPDTLIVRNAAGPFLSWAILTVEFVIGMVAAVIQPFHFLPNLFTLGDLSSFLWYPIHGSALFLIAMIHTALAYDHKRKHLLRTITLNKQAPYLIYNDHMGDSRIPTSECTITAEVDPREKEDNESAPTAIEIRHGKKRLAKWILKDPVPSDEVARMLEQGIRDYLRYGVHRNRPRRGWSYRDGNTT